MSDDRGGGTPSGEPGSSWQSPSGQPGPSWQSPSGQPGGYGGWTAGGWAPPPPDPKPGVVPLRPMGVGEILDGAITTIRSYPRPTLGFAAVVVTITELVQVAVTWSVLRHVPQVSLENTTDAREVLRVMGDTIAASSVGLVIGWLAQLVLTGLVTVTVSKAVLGQRCTTRDAWLAVRPRLLPLLGTALVSGLAVAACLVVGALPALLLGLVGAPAAAWGPVLFLGLLAGVVAAVYLFFSLSFATPAVVLERQGVIASLRRSRRLVGGTWWRVAGILVLAEIIAAVVQGVVSVPLGLLTGGGTGLFGPTATVSFATLVGGAIAGIITGTLTLPFRAAVAVLLYVDVRIRREGLDIELARAAGVPLPGGGAAPRAW